jgi:hypothetical protein
MTQSTIEISQKSAGPEGATLVTEQPSLPRVGVKITLVPFMLEDYLDAVLAKAALQDPDNAERIPWEQVKEKLGL